MPQSNFERAQVGIILWVGAVAIFALAGCEPESERSAKLSADCMTHGMVAFDRWKVKLEEIYLPSSLIDPPEFHFNKRLNTCLMKVGHWSFLPDGKSNDLVNQVIDVYENKVLLTSGHMNRYKDGKLLPMQIIGGQDLSEKAKKLMTE